LKKATDQEMINIYAKLSGFSLDGQAGFSRVLKTSKENAFPIRFCPITPLLNTRTYEKPKYVFPKLLG
jgi:hypothetical protein